MREYSGFASNKEKGTADMKTAKELAEEHKKHTYTQIYICDHCGNMNLDCPHCNRLITVSKEAAIDYLSLLEQWMQKKNQTPRKEKGGAE